MSELVSDLWPTVGLVGGIAGIVSLALTLYYRSTAHRILLARFRREEEAKEVDARMEDLRRRADAKVNSSESPVTMLRVSVELTSELDFTAARKLAQKGEASLEGNQLVFVIDRVPPAIRRDSERRGG